QIRHSDQGIIVARQSGARSQNFSDQPSFNLGKVIESLQFTVKAAKIRIECAEPGKEREQEQCACRSRTNLHGFALTGLPRKSPVSVWRKATMALTCSSVSVEFSWARPIFRTASSRVGELPS